MPYRSYRIELKLNASQRALCQKSAGTARFAYNWMLGKLSCEYEANRALATMYGLEKVPTTHGTAINWHKEWVLLKNELPWIRETSKCCGQEALRDLEVAYKRFFKKLGAYPKFKKKGQKDSFRLEGKLKISSSWVKLPNFGKVQLKEKNYAVQEGILHLKQATVIRECDRWFVSFSLETGEEDLPLADLSSLTSEDIIGVDLGVKDLGITSSGEVFSNPKAYRKHQERLARYQRRVARKQRRSKNRVKAQKKVARCHRRIKNIRKDYSHKMTTSLVRTKPKVLVIESLRPKNMVKNRKLSLSIADASFGSIKQQLVYKCRRAGIHLLFAPAFYASSKFCSCCGKKNKDLQLSDREWTCAHCGTEHDRDVNAAKNLQFFGCWTLSVSSTTGSIPGSNACGDERLQFLQEQCSSMKQEYKLQRNVAIC